MFTFFFQQQTNKISGKETHDYSEFINKTFDTKIYYRIVLFLNLTTNLTQLGRIFLFRGIS